MRKITLHAADGAALSTVEIKPRKRILLLPPPDFIPPVLIRGLIAYEAGATVEIYPTAEAVTLRLVNRSAGTSQELGDFDTLESVARLLTFADGKYISLTVEETDEEIYSKAKAIADSDAERHDKWTAAAIIIAVLFVAWLLVKINIVGLVILCLCLVAL